MKKSLPNNDRIWKAASLKYLEMLGNSLPSEEELSKSMAVSRGLDRRVLDSIHREQAAEKLSRSKSRRRTLRVLIAAALLVALLLSIFCMTMASRYRSAEMTLSSRVDQGGMAGILFQFESTEELQNSLDEIEEYKIPSYIPNGFQENENMVYKSPASLVKHYERGEDVLVYRQNAIGRCMFRVHADNVWQKDVMVNACHGILIHTHMGTNELVWNDGVYVYYLEGTLSEDEIMKTARSLKQEV